MRQCARMFRARVTVNYCDLDLPDWATSYWGANLSRLRQIKSQYDPNNIFRHAQSVQPIQSASSR